MKIKILIITVLSIAFYCNTSDVSNASCGNNTVETTEECDDGNTTNGDGCSSTCLWEPATCGDGIVQHGESCDDSNILNGDGCNSLCQKIDFTFYNNSANPVVIEIWSAKSNLAYNAGVVQGFELVQEASISAYGPIPVNIPPGGTGYIEESSIVHKEQILVIAGLQGTPNIYISHAVITNLPIPSIYQIDSTGQIIPFIP